MADSTGEWLGCRAVWLGFGAFSLAAVLTGCWIAALHGTPARLWALNIAGWVVGAGLALAISRIKMGVGRAALAISAVGLALTLFMPGLSGVHRWISVGPMRLNCAELLLPVALTSCAGLAASSMLRVLFPIGTMAILAIQPDVSQAAAVAAASVVLLATSTRSFAVRVLVSFALAGAGFVCALRPDPLAPVPEVEGIVRLAAEISPAAAAWGVLAVACALLSPLLIRGSHTEPRHAAFSLSAYLVVAALAPAIGAFPVPLMGMGVSPVLGAWLGVGWLMQIARKVENHPHEPDRSSAVSQQET